MKFRLLSALTGLTMLSAVSAGNANIVGDPSFELNNGSWNFVGFGTFAAPHTGAASAVTDCVGAACVSNLGQGAYFSQALPTVVGQSYNLSFWVGENSGPPSEMSVFWNGQLVADVLNPASNPSGDPGLNWTNYVYLSLVATSASTSLEIHGRQDRQIMFFDDVSVDAAATATPLPAALPLFASALAGLGWAARRRRKQIAVA